MAPMTSVSGLERTLRTDVAAVAIRIIEDIDRGME